MAFDPCTTLHVFHNHHTPQVVVVVLSPHVQSLDLNTGYDPASLKPSDLSHIPHFFEFSLSCLHIFPLVCHRRDRSGTPNVFDRRRYTELINGLNTVICGEPVARFRPSGAAIDEVGEHRYDLINVANQLTSCVSFPGEQGIGEQKNGFQRVRLI